MSGVRLERIQTGIGGKRVVDVEHGATKGAMLGRDLYDTDGTVISSLVDWIRTRAVAKDTARINGIPVDKIITRNGTLIVREIQAEAIQAGNLGNVVAIAGGGITAASGGNSLMLGAGFGDAGANDLVAWFGPTPGSGLMADAAKAGSLFWIDNTGSAYFGGTLSAANVQSQQLTPTGVNLVPNATFQSNLVGAPAVANTVYGSNACDNWYLAFNFAAISSDAYVLLLANGAGIRCHLGNPSLTNGQSIASQVRTRTNITGIRAGDVFNMGFTATQSFNGALRAGFSANSRMVVWFLDGSGALVSGGSKTVQLPRTATNVTANLDITAPAGAVQMAVFLDTLITNSSGATNTANTTAGTVTLQTNFTACWINRRADVEVPGSGVRLGDTRNAPGIMVANGAAKVPTAPTYTATAGAPATATITVPAFTMLSGTLSIPYSAMSAGVTGTGGTTVNYFLYCDDPGLNGGSCTLVVTTVGDNCWKGNDRVYLGTIAVTFPTAGTGGGGGTGGGSGGSCVDADAWVAPGLRAHQVQVGDWLDCVDLPTSGLAHFRGQVSAVSFAWAERVRLVSEGGGELELAADTPMDLPGGGSVLAERMMGQEIPTDRGLERVASVRRIGAGWVVRISVGGVSYAAGSRPDYRLYSHNNLKP